MGHSTHLLAFKLIISKYHSKYYYFMYKKALPTMDSVKAYNAYRLSRIDKRPQLIKLIAIELIITHIHIILPNVHRDRYS